MNTSSKTNLFEKYGNGTITDQELLQLHHWYLEHAKASNAKLEPEIFQQRMAEMDNALFACLNKAERKFYISLYSKVAAFLIIAMSITFYFWNNWTNNEKPDTVYVTDVAPGGNRARLILANGRSIDLTTADNGELAKQAGVKIMKTSDGQLTYTLTGKQFLGRGKAAEKAEYNTIEIPKGGQYGVCLPDGTKVWLNAASTLKYPATFSSLSERRVVLRGEAYFEVVHNAKRPFIVETDGQDVKDIGTKFNINSYREEPGVKTTVLEGSAAVMTTPHSPKYLPGKKTAVDKTVLFKVVKAGQQSILTDRGIAVADINADESISWKNGLFQFQNDDMQTVMRQIARWYNVEVQYEGAVPTEKLDGKVYRNIKLSKVLEILLSPGISYKIENRKVTIMSNK